MTSAARVLGKLVGAASVTALVTGSAFADQPRPWETHFQDAATPIMAQITWFEKYTLWFIIPITLLVLVLLAWCIFRFRASVHPIPSRTSHNTAIEVIWTVAPVVVLFFLAVPSFKLLTAQYTPPEEPKLTVKATGNQWNWDYEYQVGDNPLSFNSAILADTDRAGLNKEDRGEYPRLLAVDNEMVIPVNTTVRILATSTDVIHSFGIPSFGFTVDAVPGRINEMWFKVKNEGIYYGQCRELCGKDHAFMPIAVRVVSQVQYDTWYAAAEKNLPGANKALLASIDANKTKVASLAQ